MAVTVWKQKESGKNKITDQSTVIGPWSKDAPEKTAFVRIHIRAPSKDKRSWLQGH